MNMYSIYACEKVYSKFILILRHLTTAMMTMLMFQNVY